MSAAGGVLRPTAMNEAAMAAVRIVTVNRQIMWARWVGSMVLQTFVEPLGFQLTAGCHKRR